ncbi:DUF2510 domain-containing protein [Cryobacterium adonitolivorans]|uniref:DUF2510 domain-containing protein n=2 Tax=Cryobacterium adonitolivorans TaxID=1259189 RepID=A0A4R8W3I4_9MICO|nr:DUF2510 domain-containing protein [Cryobacterium adonitolivorans]
MPLTLPAAGWYQDPEDSALLRWWTGTDWSAQRRFAEPVPPPPAYGYGPAAGSTSARPAYVPMAGHGSPTMYATPPTRREKDREIRRNNSMAYTGLVLALVSCLLNPLAIPSILGIVFSAIGIAKSAELEGAGRQLTGRGTAIAGLVVGIASTAYFLWSFSTML